MKAINNKQIAGRISRLKQAISNYSREAHDLQKPNSPEAQRAEQECQNAIEEIKNLIESDPVFKDNGFMRGLPDSYDGQVRSAKLSSTVSGEAIDALSNDQAILEQDFADGNEYSRRLKELSD